MLPEGSDCLIIKGDHTTDPVYSFFVQPVYWEEFLSVTKVALMQS